MDQFLTHEALELELMNAHIAVENDRAQSALVFLSRIEFTNLAPHLEGVFHSIQGQAKVLLGEYELGVSLLRQAITDYKQKNILPADLQIERIRNWIGKAYFSEGNITAALIEHRNCLNTVIEGKFIDKRFSLEIFLNLANDYFLMEQKDTAYKFYTLALNQVEFDEDRLALAAIFKGIGEILLSKNDLPNADYYLEKSLEIFCKLGELQMVIHVQNLIGRVRIEKGDFVIAESLLKEAFSLAQKFKK